MKQITQGEWAVTVCGSGQSDSVKQYKGKPYQEHCTVEARKPNGLVKLVAHVYQGDRGELCSPAALDEQEANARLIAAAPKLLKVCEQLVEEYERGPEWVSADTIDQAVNAIIQAEGGK